MLHMDLEISQVSYHTYIAGPMTGIEDFNFPAFNAMAARLRNAGYAVINPAELDGEDTSQAWDYYLRRDLTELAKCCRVVLLPGWAKSKGASLEHHIAKTLEMDIIYPEDVESWFKYEQ